MLQKQLAPSDRNIKVWGNNFLTSLYENYSLDRTNSDSKIISHIDATSSERDSAPFPKWVETREVEQIIPDCIRNQPAI
jgi:hypothetical protein